MAKRKTKIKNKKIWIGVAISLAVFLVLLNKGAIVSDRLFAALPDVCSSTSISGAYSNFDTWVDYPDDYIGQTFVAPVTGKILGGTVYTFNNGNAASYSASISSIGENGASLSNGYIQTTAGGRPNEGNRAFTFPGGGPSVTAGQTYYLTFQIKGTQANHQDMKFFFDTRNEYAQGQAYCYGPGSGDCSSAYGDAQTDLTFGLSFEYNCGPCVQNWDCTSWSSFCSSSQQTRTCTDSNSCGGSSPLESRPCTASISTYDFTVTGVGVVTGDEQVEPYSITITR